MRIKYLYREICKHAVFIQIHFIVYKFIDINAKTILKSNAHYLIYFRNFKLSVNVPPTIAGPLVVDITSVQGSAVTLFCDVYAVPTATVRWMKDGSLVRNSDQATIVTGGTRLQIGNPAVFFQSITCHFYN